MNFLIIICLALCILCFFFIRKHSKRTIAVTPEETQMLESPSVDVPEEKAEDTNNEVKNIEDSPSPTSEFENKTEDIQEEKLIPQQNKELIANLHKVFEEDKIFLRPDIHIDDVARMLLTNRTYITRLMRQEYGLSFIEYINVARVQYSQNLLFSTDMTLDEVAEKSGFQSTSSYSRTFKRYIGAPPLTWLHGMK